MYLDHFSLTKHPFRMAPEESFVYMSQQHSRAYVYMDSTTWSPESFVVISGEVGSGKTTLLKKLIRGMKRELQLIHLAYTNLQSDDLFHLIAREAGLEVTDTNKIAMLFAIKDHLVRMSQRNIPVVLAVDEAQNLSAENLEDIRMLAGLEGDSGPMMRVILLGQPELRQSINAIPQLAQRIKLHFHLGGLSESETKGYINHRLYVAGYRGAPLFTGELVTHIHQVSRGIPRLINKLCDALMLCAFADERCHIEIDDLEEIRRDVMAEDLVTVPARVAPAQGQAGMDNSALLRIAEALEAIAAALQTPAQPADTGAPRNSEPASVKPSLKAAHK